MGVSGGGHLGGAGGGGGRGGGRKKEKNTVLCADCEELLHNAHARLDHCPFGEKKSACKECTVHCYKPVMRERMRQVMRFSGPRMLLYAPWQAIRHLLNL